jgi:hypothetical protein
MLSHSRRINEVSTASFIAVCVPVPCRSIRPVELPPKFDLAIDLKIAKALGRTVPFTLQVVAAKANSGAVCCGA